MAQRIKSIREYMPMVSKRWWVMLAIVIGDVLGLVTTVSQGVKVPIWVWIAITAAVFSLGQFEAFHCMRIIRDKAMSLNKWHMFISNHHVVIDNIEESSVNVSITGTVDERPSAVVLSKAGRFSLLDWLTECAHALVNNGEST